jgi:protocatechuate 3,4-dioxygenase beta subunit
MAKRMVLRLAACFSAAAALAWSQTNLDQPKAKSTASLQGKVVSQTTGNALKKTNLLLRPNSGGKTLSAETDDQGAFAFPTAEPGRYTPTAERAGYAKQPYGARGSSLAGAVLTLSAGQEMKELVFKLIPNAVISGKVLDEDGDPMANSAVVVLRPGYERGRKQYTSAGEAMTGATGEYSVSVTAGRYLLAAASMASLRAGLQGASAKPPGDEPETTYTTVYYPRSPDETGAAPVDAAAGAELRGMDFYMTKVKAFRVSGKLAEPQPGKTTFVVLTPRTSTIAAALAIKMVQVQPDGSFEFIGITPGQWLLRAAGETGGSASLQWLTVEDKQIAGLVVALAPLADLPGAITVEGKDTVSPKGTQVTLDGVEAGKSGGQAQAGEDGKFTVKSLMPDRYQVRISNAPANVYLKSVRYGSQDVTDDGVDMTGGVRGSIEVLLNPNGAEIDGVVADDDGKPMPGVTVALIPDSRRYRLFRSDTTDQTGAVRFQGVPPGDYKLLAWEDVVSGAWYDPEFLKPVESKAQAVAVKENDRKNVTLNAIPMETKR